MRRAIPAILELIGKGLNKQRAPVSGEALPARWVELINYLNDVERCDRASLKADHGRHLKDASQA
jgi:hypothetical protein